MELKNFKGGGKVPSILVIGDVMVDEYIVGNVNRISPEAPVPVVLKTYTNALLGGAGNVAKNVISLGAKCSICSVVGKDDGGSVIIDQISSIGIEDLLVVDESRRTTIKTRVIGNDHQIVRIDSEDSKKISEDIEKSILKKIKESESEWDSVIFQDYGKGIFNPSICLELESYFRENNIPVYVDPKPDNIDLFKFGKIIKPNLKEFKEMVLWSGEGKISLEEIDKLAKSWLSNKEFEYILITLSRDGMFLVSEDSSKYVPGLNVSVSDVSGAGDSVIACLCVMGSSGCSVEESVELSNVCGSVACQYPGPYSVSLEELMFNVKIIEDSKKSN